MRRSELNAAEYKRFHARALGVSLLAAALVAALVFAFVLLGVQVTDEDMIPLLRPADVLVLSRLSKYIRSPQRGDICLVEQGEVTCLGRIVGLPGELVQIQDGNVYIGEIYLDESGYVQGLAPDMEPVTLGVVEYLVLPDDRGALMERGDLLRPLGVDRIRGTVVLRVSPLARVSVF